MIRVGITGGIGSGKSVFCSMLKQYGACVMNGDDFAQEIMTKNPLVIQKLKQAFGDESYLPDGSINKAHLISEAFKKGKVSQLNGIVHPAMRELLPQKMKEAEKTGCLVFVYEAAILLNNGRPDGFDAIILVAAPEKTRVQRVVKRDRVSEESVTERMAAQQTEETMKKMVDYVVENDGSLSGLKDQAEKMFRRLINKQKD